MEAARFWSGEKTRPHIEHIICIFIPLGSLHANVANKRGLYVCAKRVRDQRRLKAIFKSQQLPVNGLFCSTFIICICSIIITIMSPLKIIRHSPFSIMPLRLYTLSTLPPCSRDKLFCGQSIVKLGQSYYLFSATKISGLLFFFFFSVAVISLWRNPDVIKGLTFASVSGFGRKFYRTKVKFSHVIVLCFVKFYDTVEGILSKNDEKGCSYTKSHIRVKLKYP